MADIERFTAKYVIEPNGCWRWTGALRGGYARFLVNGRNTLAHRWSYEHFVGPIPDGLTIDHLCNARGCVNPGHLQAVPWLVNVLRTDRTRLGGANRRKTHCSNGHPFDEANTATYRDKYGLTHRTCRTCHREAVKLAARLKRAG